MISVKIFGYVYWENTNNLCLVLAILLEMFVLADANKFNKVMQLKMRKVFGRFPPHVFL